MAGSGSNRNPEPDRSSASPSPSEKEAARPICILVVEDNAADEFLIRDAIRHARIEGEVHVVRDGHKAIQFLDAADSSAAAPCPDLLLLDLNLPMRSGDEVLEHLRAGRRCRDIPVLVVTSSNSDQDRQSVMDLGATGYFRKPSNYDEFMKLGLVVKHLLEPRDSGADA